MLIHVQGYLAVPQMRISREWFRSFLYLPMPHIGNIIQRELVRQGHSVAWLAKELYTDRTNMYRILKKGDLDTALLRRISVALNHDFFKYYSDELQK